MNISAIIMMLVAMLVIWGGLVVAIVNLNRNDRAQFRAEELRRDL